MNNLNLTPFTKTKIFLQEVNANSGKVCKWVDGEAVDCVKANYLDDQFRKVRSEAASYV